MIEPEEDSIDLKSSELGIGMTTCVAARAFTGEIVCVTDRKASFEHTSADDAVSKHASLGDTWRVMIAGDDVSPALPIIRRATEMFATRENTLECAIGATKEAYQSFLSDRAADEHLSRFKMDMAYFRKNGVNELGESLFREFWDKISHTRLYCRLLVAGHDADGSPHIFSIINPGVEDTHDSIGFWAIGSGATLALSTLALRGQGRIRTLPEAIYAALEAKFVSEPAPDVGEETSCIVLHPTQLDNLGYAFLSHRLLEEIKGKWEKEGRPKLPRNILEFIKIRVKKEWGA